MSFGELHLHSRAQPVSLALAFQYPYVLAFEPTFVEIRNVETGSMSQVIQSNNLHCLFTDTPPSLQQAHPRMLRSYLVVTYVWEFEIEIAGPVRADLCVSVLACSVPFLALTVPYPYW
jgi:hypothetical protein